MKLNTAKQPTVAERDNPPPSEAVSPMDEQKTEQKHAQKVKHDTVIPRHHDTMPPRYRDTVVELIRLAVKQFGKEAATHRFTLEEKKAIADVVYAYKRTGVKTSENEISRIGVNFLIEDYKENGLNSVLDRVLKALNE